MMNIPLVPDKVALRLVGFRADEAGWVDNILSPSPGGTFTNAHRVQDDVNSSVWSGGRAALRIDANDAWTVDLVGIYQKYELNGFADASLNKQIYEDTSVFPTFGHREQARFTDDDWDDEWYQLAMTIEGDLPYGSVVLTAAYFDRESAYYADATSYLQVYQQRGDYFRSFNTGDPYYDTGGIYDFGGDPIANDYDIRKADNWTIEGRYATPAEGRWSGIVGGFYNKRVVDELFISNVFNFTGSAAFAYINYAGYYFNGINPKYESNNWYSGTYDSELEQWAVFGEATINLTENFAITAGGRYYQIDNDYIVKNGTMVGLNGGDPDCAVDYCYSPRPSRHLQRRRFRAQGERQLPLRRCAAVCHLFGRLPPGRRQLRAAAVGIRPAQRPVPHTGRHPERLQFRHRAELGSGRQDRVVRQQPAPERLGLLDDLGRHPGAGGRPRSRRCSPSASSTSPRPRSTAWKSGSPGYPMPSGTSRRRWATTTANSPRPTRCSQTPRPPSSCPPAPSCRSCRT